MSEEIFIFDTTLRDGEQAGHKMSPEVKLEIANTLADAGVSVIEAGFPCSSSGDAASVRKIAREVHGATICALARVVPEDIQVAVRAIEVAKKPRLHVFAPTSDIHIEKKLQATREGVLERVGKMVTLARSLVDEVEFSAEDATRTDIPFLAKVVRVAIEAGATIINLPDTVGYANPALIQSIFKQLIWEYTPELRREGIILSTHCHDDLGLATANSLTAIQYGARQIEGCFLGIGERAGNVALEQVVMAIHCHGGDKFHTTINKADIGLLCRMISDRINYPIPAHQPIVGSLAFAHSSGIHRDGVDKDRQTYEIMEPKDVGWVGQTVQLVSHMGRNGLRKILISLGYPGELIEQIYLKFLELADRKSPLTNEDLRMLVQEVRITEEAHREHLFELINLDYRPRWVTVTVGRNGSTKKVEATGDGTVDAAFKAICQAVREHGEDMSGFELRGYEI
jgi:2-isopropylmalate synthase